MAKLQDMYEAYIAEQHAEAQKCVNSGEWWWTPNLGEKVIAHEMTHHGGRTGVSHRHYELMVVPDYTVSNPASWCPEDCNHPEHQLMHLALTGKACEYIRFVSADGPNVSGHYYAVHHADDTMNIYDVDNSYLKAIYAYYPPLSTVQRCRECEACKCVGSAAATLLTPRKFGHHYTSGDAEAWNMIIKNNPCHAFD